MINTKVYCIYKDNIYGMSYKIDDSNLIFIYTTDQSVIDDTFEEADPYGRYKKLIDISEIEKIVRVIDYVIIDGFELEVLSKNDTMLLVALTDFKIAKQFDLERTMEGKDYFFKWIDRGKHEIKRRVLEHIYSGHGCVIEKSEDDYYMSWIDALLNIELTYKISKNLIEKVKLSSKDTYDVARFLKTGEWPTEDTKNKSIIDSYLKKSPNILCENIEYQRYFTEDELKELLPIVKKIRKEYKVKKNVSTILAFVLLILIFVGIFIVSKKAPYEPRIKDCMNDTQLQNEIREESIKIIKKENEEYVDSDISDKASINFTYLKRYRDTGLSSSYSVSYDNKVFIFYIKNDEIHLVTVPEIINNNNNEIEEIIK